LEVKMGKVKRIGSNKKTLAALATAFLVLVLVVIGFASQETTSAGYGYGGGGGGGGGEPQPADTTPPVISEASISASAVTGTSATISWTTDETSTSQVEYGVTTSSLSSLNAAMVTSHTVILTDLSSDTIYNFKVRSNDASGNLAVSDEYIFTTLAAPTNWALIGGIIGAVLAVGGLAWYLWWRRRG
jgi:hypothetical protein